MVKKSPSRINSIYESIAQNMGFFRCFVGDVLLWGAYTTDESHDFMQNIEKYEIKFQKNIQNGY